MCVGERRLLGDMGGIWLGMWGVGEVDKGGEKKAVVKGFKVVESEVSFCLKG